MKLFRSGLKQMSRNSIVKPKTSKQKKIKSQAMKALVKLKIKKDKKNKARFDNDYIFCITNEAILFETV